MAKPEEVKTAIQKAQPSQTIQSMIEKSASELGRALPAHMNSERLVRIALTCIRLNPSLGECTPASFLGALFTAAQIGIEPIAGRAYLLPFNNSRKKPDGSWHTVKEVQFVMGYKGVAELFYRHSKAVQLVWDVVRENDEFNYEKGTTAFLRHKKAAGDRGKVLGYWVMAEIQGGGKPFEYWTVEACMEHGRKHSKSFNKKSNQFDPSSPWVKEPDAMCLKTVFIQLAKVLPLSVELQRALAQDETSKEYRKEIESALDLPDNTTWTDAEETEIEVIDAFADSVKAIQERVDETEYSQLLLKYKVNDAYEIVDSETRRKFLVDAGKLTKKNAVRQ